MIIYPESYRSNLLKYTRTAFNLVPEIESPRILDVGCGTGLPSLCLAELTNGSIIGVDTNIAALKLFRDKIKKAGLEDRCEALNQDIESLDFDPESFDIIWAEGSTAAIGFHKALRVLGRFLKADSFLVIHDDARGYTEKLTIAEKSRFLVFGFFLISKEVWWDEYYKHLDQNLPSATRVSPDTIYSLEALEDEILKFKQAYQEYASVFFILKKQHAVTL